tara:strand:+ start:271 stop:660 length:390 start_codon:yes stop_codon:yes gene_type:complete
MVLQNPQKIKDSLQPLVSRQGYNVETMDFKTQPRGSLWRETSEGVWEEMKNLPLDPYHLQRYLARGFKIDPPDTLPSSDRLPYLSLDPNTQLSFDDTENFEGDVTIDRVAPEDENIGQSQGVNPVISNL